MIRIINFLYRYANSLTTLIDDVSGISGISHTSQAAVI